MSVTGDLHADANTKALIFNLSSLVKGVQLALSVRFQISVFIAKNPSPLSPLSSMTMLFGGSDGSKVVSRVSSLCQDLVLTATSYIPDHRLSKPYTILSALFTTSRIKHHYRSCDCQIWSHPFLVCSANISDIEAPPPVPAHVWSSS